LLPLNYQYPLSAWIYKVLDSADKDFAKILHDTGYKLKNGKTFKLFTFSRLNFPKGTYKHKKNSDRLEIKSRECQLTVAFQLPEQFENFLKGIFSNQTAYIGDKKSGIQMRVVSVEPIIQDIPPDNKIRLKTITPVVMGIKEPDKKYEQYISPLQEEYKTLFLNNLIEKYYATGKDTYSINDIDMGIIKLYTKTSLQTIKDGTPEETKVKGYYYEFELKAPKEIIEVGLNAGFGSMNSLGFGYCEMMKGE
jgi:CRISPR-associated endoribonuclease Cas6